MNCPCDLTSRSLSITNRVFRSRRPAVENQTMKKPTLRNVAVLFVALVASMLQTPARAGDQAPDKDGWATIFDGTSMDGWRINESPTSWKVQDGALVACGPRSHLFYVGDDTPFVNFEFQADVKTTPGSNAGIYFHSKFVKSGWPTGQGYECQVNTSHPDPQKTGGLYNTVKVLDSPSTDNKWFKQHIKVDGKRIVVKIDGKTVVDYTEPETTSEAPCLGKGTFTLQAHDPKSVVYFKNIKVKRLP